MVRIAICAPGKRLKRERAEAVEALVAGRSDVSLQFHEQCFAEDGHFAGSDDVRLAALLDCANDPGFDAVWFAMGGYGSNRIAPQAVAQMNAAARDKSYLGYSDTGFLLAALYRHGIGRVAHGPLAGDVRREGGAAAIERALDWFKGGEDGLEPGLDTRPAVAFNLATLAMLVGTELAPDLSGHVVMVEEVAEHLYAIDRLLFPSTTARLAPTKSPSRRTGAGAAASPTSAGRISATMLPTRLSPSDLRRGALAPSRAVEEIL